MALPAFFTYVFIGMVWLPGHSQKDVAPDEFYAMPVSTHRECMKLELSFVKAMEDRASVFPLADEVAPRWNADCRIYLTGSGQEPS